MKNILTASFVILLGLGATLAPAKQVALLNVSYDPTRELYEDYNRAFADYWKKQTGDDVTVSQSTAVPASRRARSSMASRPTW